MSSTAASSLRVRSAVSFGVTDSDNSLPVYGKSDGISKITGVTGDATIQNVGGASQVETDKQGRFQFQNQTFKTAGDDTVTFDLTSETVTAIDGLSGNVVGKFDAVTAINGHSFIITGDDGDLTVHGADTSIVGISGVGSSSGVQIQYVGGASFVATDTEGTFTFGGGQSFTVEGDSSVKFITSTDEAPASVTGVNDFNAPATITGQLNDVSINGSNLAINILGDSDSVFSYAIDSASSVTLGAVGGDNVTISGVAGASVVQVVNDGQYDFFGNQAFTLSGGDSAVNFVLNGQTVTAIDSFDKGDTISGDFTSAITVSGGTSTAVIQIGGDSSIAVVNDDDILIRDLSNGATIQFADNVLDAWTDSVSSSLAVTDSDGHHFTISGGDSNGVNFKLDGKGHISGVEDLDSDATLRGNLDTLTAINNQTFSIGGDSNFGVVGADSGISKIIELSGGATVNNVGGASEAITDTVGTIYFGSVSFAIDGDSSVTFGIDGKSSATLISDLNGTITSYGFSAITSVNEQKFSISGDSGDLVLSAQRTLQVCRKLLTSAKKMQPSRLTIRAARLSRRTKLDRSASRQVVSCSRRATMRRSISV